jgi:signal transduction histidine kinase
MHERAKAVDGVLKVTSTPGKGTKIVVEIASNGL